MEYTYQYSDIILFEWQDKRWEIKLKNEEMTENEIQDLIQRRISELENDLQTHGDLDHSDLYVDYMYQEFLKNEVEQNGNNH
jgi:hypothetical protein